MKLDFYGDIADYRKIEELINEISKIKGCKEVRTQSILEDLGYSEDERKMCFIWAGHSPIIVEWILENKEFLVALAVLITALLKKPEHKIIINNNITINFGDNINVILNKLKEGGEGE